MNTGRNIRNGASPGVRPWSLKDHSTSGGSLPPTRPPFPFPPVSDDRAMNGAQPLPPQLSPSPRATIPGISSSSGCLVQRNGPTGLWLIDKYLQSVDQISASLTQTDGRPTMSRDNVRTTLTRSPQSSSDEKKSDPIRKEGSGHDRPFHRNPPSSGGGDLRDLHVQTTSVTSGEGRLKVEPPVDAATLTVWTEYFRKLYVYNRGRQEEREARVDSRTKPNAVDSPKPDAIAADPATVSAAAPKPQLPLRASSSNKGRAGSKGSGTPTRVAPVLSPSRAESSSSSNGGGGFKPRLGCTVCGLVDVNWTIADFEKHVKSEEHRTRYNNRYSNSSSSSNTREYCKVCGQFIEDFPSRHCLNKQHLKILALLQKGCSTCKVECFEVYKDYADHINGIEHKNLQSRNKLENSGDGSRSAEGASVNVIDRNNNEEKSKSSDQTIPDSSQDFDITTGHEDRERLVKKVKTPVTADSKRTVTSSPGLRPQPSAGNVLKRRPERRTAEVDSLAVEINQKRLCLASSSDPSPDGDSQSETTKTDSQLPPEPKKPPQNPMLEKDSEDCCDDDVFVSVPGVYCKVCKTIFDSTKCTRKQHSQLDSHRRNSQKLQRNSLSSDSSPEKQKALPECNINENTVGNNQKSTPQPSVEMGMDSKMPLEEQEHCKPDEDLSLRKDNTDKQNVSYEIVVVGTTEQTDISTIESSSCVAEDKTASNSVEIMSVHLESSQKSQEPLTDGRMVDDEAGTNSKSDICQNLQSGNLEAQSEHDVSPEVQHYDTEMSDSIQIPVFDVTVQATTQNEQHNTTIGDSSSPITPQQQPSQEDNLPDSMDEYSYIASVSGDSANNGSHTKTSANDYNVVRNDSTDKEMSETLETNSRVVNINCQDNKEAADNLDKASSIDNTRDETATEVDSAKNIVEIPEVVGKGCKVS